MSNRISYPQTNQPVTNPDTGTMSQALASFLLAVWQQYNNSANNIKTVGLTNGQTYYNNTIFDYDAIVGPSANLTGVTLNIPGQSRRVGSMFIPLTVTIPIAGNGAIVRLSPSQGITINCSSGAVTVTLIPR